MSSRSETSADRKLWYRVLDLDQTADQDLETVWEDATRWTRWYELPWHEEPGAVGMSLFNVYKMVDHHDATVPGERQVRRRGA